MPYYLTTANNTTCLSVCVAGVHLHTTDMPYYHTNIHVGLCTHAASSIWWLYLSWVFMVSERKGYIALLNVTQQQCLSLRCQECHKGVMEELQQQFSDRAPAGARV